MTSAGGRSSGIYLAEITKSEEVYTKSKHELCWLVTFSAAGGDRAALCEDRLMIEGKGRGITRQKLKGLGFADDQKDIGHLDLIGRRAWIAIKDVDRGYGPQTQVQLDGNGVDGSNAGYWPESDRPEGAESDSAPAPWDPPSSGTPF